MNILLHFLHVQHHLDGSQLNGHSARGGHGGAAARAAAGASAAARRDARAGLQVGRRAARRLDHRAHVPRGRRGPPRAAAVAVDLRHVRRPAAWHLHCRHSVPMDQLQSALSLSQALTLRKQYSRLYVIREPQSMTAQKVRIMKL